MNLRSIVACGLVAFVAGCTEEEAPDGSRTGEEDAHAATIEARIDATNRGDFAGWEALHAPGACRTAPDLEAPLCGADAMRAALETLTKAFPDYHLELVDVVTEGDTAVALIHTTGTWTGPLAVTEHLSLPPNGRSIDQQWTAWARFDAEGRIVSFDELYDQQELLVQLGLADGL